MSHRRKDNAAKKASNSKLLLKIDRTKEPMLRFKKREGIGPEQIGIAVESILTTGHMNFRCPKCTGRDHVAESGEHGAMNFICPVRGWEMPVIIPCFIGETEDFLAGYMVAEVPEGSNELCSLHFFGLVPEILDMPTRLEKAEN